MRFENRLASSPNQPVEGTPPCCALRRPSLATLDVRGLKVVPSWLTVTGIRLDKLQVSVAPPREFCWRVGHRSR